MFARPAATDDAIVGVQPAPFVGVALALLAAALVTAAAEPRRAAIPQDLPHGERAPWQDRTTLPVSLDSNGQVFVGNDAVADADLADAVRVRALGDPEAHVFLHASGDVAHGRVVFVLDRVRAAGVRSISLRPVLEH